MRTVPVNEFFPLIAPVAEGCPEFVMRRAIVDTVNDICRRTGCVVSQAVFKTEKGRAHYGFNLPMGLKAEGVKRLYCGGNRVRIANMDELERRYPEDFEKYEGSPLYFVFRKPYAVQLVPKPDAEYECRMDITVSVDHETTNIPEIFFTEYSDAVTYGVLSRVFAHAGQPYSNAAMATQYRVMYSKQLTFIKTEAAAGFQRTSGTVLFNRIV